MSFDSDDVPISHIVAPGGPEASASAPLEVDPGGYVEYLGKTDSVITEGTWSLKVFGFQVQGDDAVNKKEETKKAGVADLDFVPIDVPGLYHVSGSIEGGGGSCMGELWVKILGNPIGTLPWIAGVTLFGIGAIGLAFSRPTTYVLPAPEPEQAWGPQDPRHPQ